MPCTVVAEIGINHNGDIDTALSLVRAAAHAGADHVKFQKRTPELCVPRHQWDVPRETPWGVMPYIEYKRRMEFGHDEFTRIDELCADLGLGWFLSVWDLPSLDFALEWETTWIKVPSALLTDDGLVSAVADEAAHTILSTGMSTIEEIDHAVQIVRSRSLTIMHCHSAYPAPTEELNLYCIPWLHTEYPNARIGYSGHEYGLEPTVWAVILGAQIVERHITLDRTSWGSDQLASVEPLGFERLVRHIRSAERAVGDGVKRVWESEQTAMRRLRPVNQANVRR